MNPFDIEKLEQVAAREGMNLGNAEKDYVLSVVLSELSELEISRQLVFKGGTALKKAYFPKYRFSSDLDFTAIRLEKENVKREINATFNGKTHGGMQFTKVLDKSEERGNNLNILLQYESQISKVEGRTQLDSVKLDINFDNIVALSAVERQLVFPAEYGVNATFRAMALEEIATEKVHAIYSRTKPRDLYDLWFLLTSGVRLSEELANEKLKDLETDEEGAPLFGINSFKPRIEGLSKKWGKDIGNLLNTYPSFDCVKEELLKNIQTPTMKENIVHIWTKNIREALKNKDVELLKAMVQEIAGASHERKILNSLELKEQLQLVSESQIDDTETTYFVLLIYVNQCYFFRNLVADASRKMFGWLSGLLRINYPSGYSPLIKANACALILASDNQQGLERFLEYVKDAEQEEWYRIIANGKGGPNLDIVSDEMKEKLYDRLSNLAGDSTDFKKRAKSLLSTVRMAIDRNDTLKTLW